MTILKTTIKIRVLIATIFLVAAGIGAYGFFLNNINNCSCAESDFITEDFTSYNNGDIPNNMELIMPNGDEAYVSTINGINYFTFWTQYFKSNFESPLSRTDIRYTNIPTTTNKLDVEVTGYFGFSGRQAIHVLTDQTASNGYYIVWHDRNQDVPNNNVRIYKQNNSELTVLASSNQVEMLIDPIFEETSWRVVAQASTNKTEITVYKKEGNNWNELVSYTDTNNPYTSGGLAFSQYYGQGNPTFSGWTINYSTIPVEPLAAITSEYNNWQGKNVLLEYTLTQPGNIQQSLNLLSSSNTGIYYSVDGEVWLEATDAGGISDGKEDLITDKNGNNFTFIWDANTDVPDTEIETVYLRLRATNGSNISTSWATSTVFKLDTKAPVVNLPIMAGGITTSSVVLTKPSSTDAGSGNNQWILNRGTSTIATIASTTENYTDTELSENTAYSYSVQFSDMVGNISNATGSVIVYTKAITPSTLSVLEEKSAFFVQTDSMLNSLVSSSGYYFENIDTGENSGWIQTNIWQDTTARCGKSYQYQVKKRNQQAEETEAYSTLLSFSGCMAAALPNSGYFRSGGGENNIPSVGGSPELITEVEKTPSTTITDENSNEEIVLYCDLLQSVPYKSPLEKTVFLLVPSVDGCKKQAFVNEAVYFSYFDSWKVIQDVDFLNDISWAEPSLVEKPLAVGMLVKEINDPKVYVIIDNNGTNELLHIPDEASFVAAGYDWKDIIVYYSLGKYY